MANRKGLQTFLTVARISSKNCVITEAFSVVLLFAYSRKRYDSKHLINRNENFFFSSNASISRGKNSSLIITFCFCLIRFYYWITQSDCIDFCLLPASIELGVSSAVFIFPNLFAQTKLISRCRRKVKITKERLKTKSTFPSISWKLSVLWYVQFYIFSF